MAGTSAVADAWGDDGFQVSSRRAIRYRSVASNEIVSPSISTRTPVNTGNSSSRPAATTTWATAWAKTSLDTAPVAAGIDGSDG